MSSRALFHAAGFVPSQSATSAADLHDRVQLALAIADPPLLRSLLTDAIPPILDPHQLGAVSSQVGVPLAETTVADAILHFEAHQCQLANPQPSQMPAMPRSRQAQLQESRELARLTQYEAELRTLGQNLSLSAAIALLTESGLPPADIDTILRLPKDGWHKPWWYALDEAGCFTLPFLRHIRLLHYPDGTLTVQYKDFFGVEKPPCFANAPEAALVFVRSPAQSFSATLLQINQQRSHSDIDRVILICQSVTELEARAFVQQGISVYPAAKLVLPIQTDCRQCGRQDCPMQQLETSPIALCRRFVPAVTLT